MSNRAQLLHAALRLIAVFIGLQLARLVWNPGTWWSLYLYAQAFCVVAYVMGMNLTRPAQPKPPGFGYLGIELTLYPAGGGPVLAALLSLWCPQAVLFPLICLVVGSIELYVGSHTP